MAAYGFTGEADASLSEFAAETARNLLSLVEEAADDGFYNHETYSYVYDTHGRPWDKLDAKEERLNHRIFFTEVEGTFYILDIFERDEMDYEERGLYKRLHQLAAERDD